MGTIQNSINQLLTLSGAAAYLGKQEAVKTLHAKQNIANDYLNESEREGYLNQKDNDRASNIINRNVDTSSIVGVHKSIQQVEGQRIALADARNIALTKMNDKIDQGEQFKKVKELVQQNANLFDMEVKNNG